MTPSLLVGAPCCCCCCTPWPGLFPSVFVFRSILTKWVLEVVAQSVAPVVIDEAAADRHLGEDPKTPNSPATPISKQYHYEIRRYSWSASYLHDDDAEVIMTVTIHWDKYSTRSSDTCCGLIYCLSFKCKGGGGNTASNPGRICNRCRKLQVVTPNCELAAN